MRELGRAEPLVQSRKLAKQAAASSDPPPTIGSPEAEEDESASVHSPDEAAQAVSGADDDDFALSSDVEEAAAPEKRTPKVHLRKGSVRKMNLGEKAIEDLDVIQLEVPRGTVMGDVVEAISISYDDTFVAVCTAIYRVLGCADVKNKAALRQLTFKPSTAKIRSSAYPLTSDDDLDLLRQQAEDHVFKKKSATPAPIFNVIVDDAVLAALRARNTKGSGAKVLKKTKGKQAPVKINFDASDDDASGAEGDLAGGNLDSAGFSAREQAAGIQLKALYYDVCKEHPLRWCILVGTKHVLFTMQMIRSWTIAKADGQDGVTEKKPPHNTHFADYWRAVEGNREPASASKRKRRNSVDDSDAHGAFPDHPHPPYPHHMYGMPHPYPYPPPYTVAPYSPHPPARAHRIRDDSSVAPSSDPAEPVDAPSPYSTLVDFCNRLNEVPAHAGRQLPWIAAQLLDQGFIHIDEVVDMDAADIIADIGGARKGDVVFMLRKVADEIARVKKVQKKAKKARV
ncbi:hypothetical protein AURDEDRAFT_177878 [Auricularia subglabra TFB-10046 SS5]|uniref:Uncharacterized protein n=1 Tax=Auricularia subglabra (strain TFB-10046 / SS5) TaxID=717982 RepID=J0L9J8_AURST|nr:hypothetical protein AURDEDRAFT_177878 [Auricularia subglabra TFB-10046 SS5]